MRVCSFSGRISPYVSAGICIVLSAFFNSYRMKGVNSLCNAERLNREPCHICCVFKSLLFLSTGKLLLLQLTFSPLYNLQANHRSMASCVLSCLSATAAVKVSFMCLQIPFKLYKASRSASCAEISPACIFYVKKILQQRPKSLCEIQGSCGSVIRGTVDWLITCSLDS